MTASKLYRVESFVQGLAIKAPCRAHTTGPVTLNGLQTINTHVGSEGDRILVKDQVNPIENGIYTMEISDWRRDGDFDGSRDVVGGTLVPVWDHTAGAMAQYQVVGQPAKKTPGTDSITFSLFTVGSPPPGGSFELTGGACLIVYQTDDAEFISLCVNDTEQLYSFGELGISSAAIQAFRVNTELWVAADNVFIGGAGATKTLGFYARGATPAARIASVSGALQLIPATNFSVQVVDARFSLDGNNIQDFTIMHQSVSSSAGALSIAHNLGQSFALTLSENITSWTFSNLPTPLPGGTGLIQFEGQITQDASVARTITWPASFKFVGGTAPDLSTLSSVHLIHFRSVDGGTTWLVTAAAEFA